MPSRTSQKSHTHLSGSRRVMSDLYSLLVMSNHRMPEASNRLVIASSSRRSYPEEGPSCASLLRLGYQLLPSPSTDSDRFALYVGAADGMPCRGRSPVLGLLDQG